MGSYDKLNKKKLDHVNQKFVDFTEELTNSHYDRSEKSDDLLFQTDEDYYTKMLSIILLYNYNGTKELLDEYNKKLNDLRGYNNYYQDIFHTDVISFLLALINPSKLWKSKYFDKDINFTGDMIALFGAYIYKKFLDDEHQIEEFRNTYFKFTFDMISYYDYAKHIKKMYEYLTDMDKSVNINFEDEEEQKILQIVFSLSIFCLRKFYKRVYKFLDKWSDIDIKIAIKDQEEDKLIMSKIKEKQKKEQKFEDYYQNEIDKLEKNPFNLVEYYEKDEQDKLDIILIKIIEIYYQTDTKIELERLKKINKTNVAEFNNYYYLKLKEKMAHFILNIISQEVKAPWDDLDAESSAEGKAKFQSNLIVNFISYIYEDVIKDFDKKFEFMNKYIELTYGKGAIPEDYKEKMTKQIRHYVEGVVINDKKLSVIYSVGINMMIYFFDEVYDILVDMRYDMDSIENKMKRKLERDSSVGPAKSQTIFSLKDFKNKFIPDYDDNEEVYNILQHFTDEEELKWILNFIDEQKQETDYDNYFNHLGSIDKDIYNYCLEEIVNYFSYAYMHKDLTSNKIFTTNLYYNLTHYLYYDIDMYFEDKILTGEDYKTYSNPDLSYSDMYIKNYLKYSIPNSDKSINKKIVNDMRDIKITQLTEEEHDELGWEIQRYDVKNNFKNKTILCYYIMTYKMVNQFQNYLEDNYKSDLEEKSTKRIGEFIIGKIQRQKYLESLKKSKDTKEVLKAEEQPQEQPEKKKFILKPLPKKILTPVPVPVPSPALAPSTKTQKSPKTPKTPESPNKILNPETGRMINANGATAKKLGLS